MIGKEDKRFEITVRSAIGVEKNPNAIALPNVLDHLCIVASGALVWRCATFARGGVPRRNPPASMAHDPANPIPKAVSRGLKAAPFLLALLGFAVTCSALSLPRRWPTMGARPG